MYMIATLSGRVAEKLAEAVVLDVGGVGYELFVTAEDHGRLETGKEVKVYIYEHIRENTHDLFGFISQDTKALFELLLGVNGVGPRMALNMLSIGTTNAVRQAIAAGDVKFIQAANGVGKRVAERVVVDLKDKVGLLASANALTDILGGSELNQKDEAVQALIALGYSAADANQALKSVPTDLPTEERIKLALRP